MLHPSNHTPVSKLCTDTSALLSSVAQRPWDLPDHGIGVESRAMVECDTLGFSLSPAGAHSYPVSFHSCIREPPFPFCPGEVFAAASSSLLGKTSHSKSICDCTMTAWKTVGHSSLPHSQDSATGDHESACWHLFLNLEMEHASLLSPGVLRRPAGPCSLHVEIQTISEEGTRPQKRPQPHTETQGTTHSFFVLV